MSTLQDVHDLRREVRVMIDLFGTAPEVVDGFNERFRAIGTAICEDLQIGTEEARALPKTMILGPSAREKFQELRDWWHAVNEKLEGEELVH